MNGAPVFSCEVDLVIVGGGIAGLWLGNVLINRGYQILLLEAGNVGGAQTLASQGMIHGGLKYALSGGLTGASEAIGGMPDRWRACLEGSGEVDLRALKPLSDRYYLFAEASALGRLTGFFASKALRGRIEKLTPADYPAVFCEPGFNGVVYALNDLVLDTRDLVSNLRAALAGRLFRHALQPEQITRNEDGVELQLAGATITARQLMLCSGAGTQTLLDGLHLPAPQMQLRPLHQVVVRHDYPQPMYAHCLTGIRRSEPRLTITSHPDGDGWLWYLGGQLATEGVTLSEAAQVAHARNELTACVPWISWRNAEFSSLRIDRAEARQPAGRRPDEAFAAASGSTIVCWPTKLSLAPDLTDKVTPLLDSPGARSSGANPDVPLPVPDLGRAPWEA